MSTGERFLGMSVRAVLNEPKTVDLGLPSGTLWADRNLGALSPTDYGEYFSWGNVDGHEAGSGYDFSDTNYNASPGKQVSGDISLSNDAANVNWGGDWRMPAKSDIRELYDNTDREWTTVNGINGMKFMKKTDHSVYIFLPAAGIYRSASRSDANTNGYYWSASIYTGSSAAYIMDFASNTIDPQNVYNRKFGISVRAVQ
jgi:uncharacterized protein (TIGR02145 family)